MVALLILLLARFLTNSGPAALYQTALEAGPGNSIAKEGRSRLTGEN